jgi:hypothetical protein
VGPCLSTHSEAAGFETMEKRRNDEELQFAILQILLSARKKCPRSGGASGLKLLDRLNLDSVERLENTLRFLLDNKLIEPGERVFMITADGVDYVADHQVTEPPEDPPGPSDPPWSPGDPGGRRPPEIDPDDPSRVPRRPKPTGGSRDRMLNLPDMSDSQP